MPDDLQGASVLSRPRVYASKPIQARRKRILKEARWLIAKKGIEGFNVRELSARSEVALRTLYIGFYSKDRIIALAIREAFDDVHKGLEYSTSVTTIAGIVDRLITVNQRNFKARNYTRAVCSLYFGANTAADVRGALQAMAFMNLYQWLEAVRARGDFHEWVVVDELANDVVATEYGIINDWANGRIRDADYLRRLVVGMLRAVLGSLRGRTRTEVAALLRRIHAEGKLPSFPLPVRLTTTSRKGLPASAGKSGNTRRVRARSRSS